MTCSLCGHDGLVSFLDLGDQPLANKYPREADFASEDFFPLNVLFCPSCRNVQLGTVVSRQRMFEDYYYLSSVNAGLVRHFEGLAGKLADARFVVDIGSNDGILLKPLKERGVRALGIEPSINVSRIANDAGLETLTAFFDAATARSVAAERGKADVIVASSVFTHLEDPHAFTEAVKELLSEDGRFIIEVEYIGNIIASVQFERFYLDRVFYYSLTSLCALFDRHGLAVTDVAAIDPHGGSLQVTVRWAGTDVSPTAAVGEQLAIEAEALTEEKLSAFREAVDTQVAALRAALADFRASGIRVAGYGAPARVSTICNYGRIGPDLIPFTVDDSPLKQDKFTPGTHIPIVTKAHLDEQGADVLVVFAYEYLEDIRRKTGDAYRYYLPIPPRDVT